MTKHLDSNPIADAAVRFLIVDLFCGAGGTTTGFHQAVDAAGRRICKVIACVNHDPMAIESHWANYPDVRHFQEDIRTLDLTELVALVQRARSRYLNAKLILWASLECTNFSNAKGGLPRDPDSRTLAEHLDRYIDALKPEYIELENVVEFMSWGPLDERGKPVSRKNGRDWLRWRQHICDAFGYYDTWREMNSADFGAFTARNRLFGIFAKPGLPIAWPAASHAKHGHVCNEACKDGCVRLSKSLFGELSKWKAVRQCLDLSDEGDSIFGRKKPLVEKTLERIYAGLVKFVANGDDGFLSKYYSGKPEYKNISLSGPSGTLTTVDSHAAVFITKWNSTSKNGKVSAGSSEESPCPTITVQQRLGVVLLKYYGATTATHSTDDPAGALTTKDRMAAVFITRQFSNGGGQHVALDNPMGALTTVNKAHLVSCKPFVLSTHFDNVGSPVDAPLGVITANRKQHYLVNPQYTCKGWDINRPCFTLIARMDKRPPLLVSVDQLRPAPVIVLREDDSTATVKIKLFMAHYGISDIRMRMLNLEELKLIQGFPATYTLCGTKADQKKFIGNSVVPQVVKAWAEAMANELDHFLSNDKTVHHATIKRAAAATA